MTCLGLCQLPFQVKQVALVHVVRCHVKVEASRHQLAIAEETLAWDEMALVKNCLELFRAIDAFVSARSLMTLGPSTGSSSPVAAGRTKTSLSLTIPGCTSLRMMHTSRSTRLAFSGLLRTSPTRLRAT